MVVGIVGELEYVGRQGNLVLGGVAVLCGIFVQNGIGIAGYVFIGVDGDKSRGSDVCVDVVSEETFAETRDDDVV